MKNDLLRISANNSSHAEERFLTSNDILELIVVNKIQRGDFDEFVEEVTFGHDGEPEESAEESCDWCRDECDSREYTVNKKVTNVTVTESNSMKFLYAGYTDCMDEAIRFLVEEENISPENPVVRNLRAHLEHSKERILDAASEVFCRLNVEGGRSHSPGTDHANPFAITGFLGEPLPSWNTG